MPFILTSCFLFTMSLMIEKEMAYNNSPKYYILYKGYVQKVHAPFASSLGDFSKSPTVRGLNSRDVVSALFFFSLW